MRIAQIAPLIEAVPPKLYGGTERIVSFLTETLVEMGHDVTLFASGDSVTSARHEKIGTQALRLDPSIRVPTAPHMLMLERAFQMADKFDVLHFHIDYHWFYSLFSRQATKVTATVHGRLDIPEIWPIFEVRPQLPIVSISDAQRIHLRHANWAGTIHHGIPARLLTPLSVTPSYLAFLGRIAPEKRVDRAIEIARHCGIPIRIAAKVDPYDQDYYDSIIKPMLSQPGVEYIGEIDDSRKSEFLSGALALLMPGDWPEPFGLAMIEAMACGTPVIAHNAGSIPEVVEDGLTGFVCNDLSTAVAAVGRLGTLSRTAVRRRFEQRFTARRMAEDYLALYDALLTR